MQIKSCTSYGRRRRQLYELFDQYYASLSGDNACSTILVFPAWCQLCIKQFSHVAYRKLNFQSSVHLAVECWTYDDFWRVTSLQLGIISSMTSFILSAAFARRHAKRTSSWHGMSGLLIPRWKLWAASWRQANAKLNALTRLFANEPSTSVKEARYKAKLTSSSDAQLNLANYTHYFQK